MKVSPFQLILLALLLVLTSGFRPQSVLLFTPEERQWLDEHEVIRVGYFPWFPPLQFVEDGEIKGLAPDYIDRLAELYNLPFEAVTYPSQEAAWEALIAGEIDLLPAAESTPLTREQALFTHSYLNFRSVFVTAIEHPKRLTEADLISHNDLRLTVVSQSAIHDYFNNAYPDIPLSETSDVESGLREISLGTASILAATFPEAGYHMRQLGLSNLSIAGRSEHVRRFAAAVNSSEAPLRSILDKAVAELLPETRMQINQRWFHFDQPQPGLLDKIRALGLPMLLLIALSAAALWIFTLHRIVKRRTADLKQSLQELTNAHTRIQQSLDNELKLSEELQKRSLDLLEMNEQRSEILRILADNLQQLLNEHTIQTAELKNELTALPDSARLMTQLKTLEKQALQGRRIIDELLTMDALETGQFVVRPDRADLVPLIRKSIDRFTDVAKEKNITLVAQHPECLDAIIDSSFSLVIDNLLSNAIKFSPPDKQVWITVAELTSTGKIRIEVKDQGPGLTAEDRQKLFSKYCRLSAQPTAGEFCVGLGLAISQELAKLHNGKVKASSVEGEGAVFAVELPLP